MQDVNVDDIDAMLDAQDRAMRAGLTGKKLLEYRRWVGEVMDCEECGAVDQEVSDSGSHPDYIGTTDWWELACGHTKVYSDGPEAVR